jgi:hypothetical protein
MAISPELGDALTQLDSLLADARQVIVVMLELPDRSRRMRPRLRRQLARVQGAIDRVLALL